MTLLWSVDWKMWNNRRSERSTNTIMVGLLGRGKRWHRFEWSKTARRTRAVVVAVTIGSESQNGWMTA